MRSSRVFRGMSYTAEPGKFRLPCKPYSAVRAVGLVALAAVRAIAVCLAAGALLTWALVLFAVMQSLGSSSGFGGIAGHMNLPDICCADITWAPNRL